MNSFHSGVRRVILLSVCIFAGVFTVSSQNVVPRFELSECPVPVPETEKNLQCGYVVVPENRSIKNSKTVRLPIIILKSLNPNAKPDPILRTFGGPGSSSLKMIRSRNSSPWLKDRDVIIFEQRGTKYAQPALECPEVDEANISSTKNQLDSKGARTKEVQAARRCYERLTKQGIDLSSYNSRESAADIEDVRRVLKLEKINLYGVSYSSRLMLEVMRDFPNGIRSVVLESTLPPEANYDEVGVDGFIRALNLVFANCKADAVCSVAYPALESEFYADVAKLNKEPIIAAAKDGKAGETSEVKLNGNDFTTWIIDYLLSNDALSIADTPLVIHDVFQGNYDAFRRYASEKIGPSSNAWGMRYSFWCGEEIPFESRKKIDAQSSKFAGLKGYEVMALPDICTVWKVPPAKPLENKPVTSDIPAMVITADYDAYTPPAWGNAVAKRLKNSFIFQVPWAGHGPGFSSPCARQMIADFFENPAVAPDSACLEKVRRSFRFQTKK